MKLWGTIALSLVLGASAARAASAPGAVPIRDADGNTWAVVVTCSDCQTAAKKGCHSGVEDGWFEGQPCGRCLANENIDAKFHYPYDIHVVGKLVDVDGNPVKDRFVKMFMANGWTVRTKTLEDGKFRLVLGAMDERKSHTPIVTDLGVRVDSKDANKEHYALHFLPESYKPCPPGEPEASKGKPKKP